MFEKNNLINAIDNGDITSAIELYNQGERIPYSPNNYDYSQLYDTILRIKGFELLNLFADHGDIEKDIYLIDKLDDSIFSKLIQVRNPNQEYLDFFQQFINNSENINDEVSGQTLIGYAIEHAAEPSILQALISAGCRVDFKNQAEDNLINQSIKKYGISANNLTTYIELLINEGVDIQETNKVGQSALHIALDSNKPHILDTLLQHGADPNLQDTAGNSAFFIAVAHKQDLELYNKLAEFDQMNFEQTNKMGTSALHEYLRTLSASTADKPDLLIKMIEDGADLNSISPYYNKELTAWDWIVQKKSSLLEKIFDIVQPDVNAQDSQGNTLLHKVASVDSNYDQNVAKETYKKVKFLLDAGASANIVNNNEQTPLMLASQDNLKSKSVELLLFAQQKEN